MDVKAALLYRTLRPVDYTALLAAVNAWMNADDMILRHSPSGGETHILFSNPMYHAILSLHQEKIDPDLLETALQAPTLGFKNFDYDDALHAHKIHVAITVGDGPMHVTPEIRAWMGRMGKHQDVPSFPMERKLIALNAIVQQFIQHDVPELVYWAQSDMVYSPDEVSEAGDMLFPLPLVVRPMPIDGGIDLSGHQTVGVRLEGSERFVGRTMVMEPSTLPFAESMGFVMWLTSQRIEGRLTLEHGAGLETPGFPTLFLRHEMPDALDPQGRIVVSQHKPDVYAVTATYPGMTTLLSSHQPAVQPSPQTVMQPAPQAPSMPMMPVMQPPAAPQPAPMPHHQPVPQQPMVAMQPAPQPMMPTPQPAPQPMVAMQPAAPQPAPMPTPMVAEAPRPSVVPQPAPQPEPAPVPYAAPAPQPAPPPPPEPPALAPQPVAAQVLPASAEITQPEAPMVNPFAEAIAAAARASERENVVPLAVAPADNTEASALVAPVGWANAANRSATAPKTAHTFSSNPPNAQSTTSQDATLSPTLQANIPAHHTVDVAQTLVEAAADAPSTRKPARSNRLSLLPLRAVSGAVAVVFAIAAGLVLGPQFEDTRLDMAGTAPSISMMTAPQLPGQN